ncbi:MAG: lytic transglycosylase domain-containing protein, partial [Jatrophihabitans sp.]|uniref:lytic transglycosylase domain-containing protein n=1 Tax=Jatrophihabitans sp. TaxID=1932789 RepID=UPI003F81326E
SRSRHTHHGGRDGDPGYARAGGPMQFIPSTWKLFGVDADRDGVADPFDIFDAAATAARYLCAAGGDLSTLAGRTRAVLAYNHSTDYLRAVLALADRYAGRPVTIIPPTAGPDPAARSAAPGRTPRSPSSSSGPRPIAPSPTSSSAPRPSSPGPTSTHPSPSSSVPRPSPSSSCASSPSPSGSSNGSPSSTAPSDPSSSAPPSSSASTAPSFSSPSDPSGDPSSPSSSTSSSSAPPPPC